MIPKPVASRLGTISKLREKGGVRGTGESNKRVRLPGLAQFDRPEPEAVRRPVFNDEPEERRDGLFVDRPVEIPRHVRIAVDRRHCLLIRWGPRPKAQPRGRKFTQVGHGSIVADPAASLL